MFEPSTQAQLKQAISDCIDGDRGILDALREEIRPLKQQTKRIQPRATTSISLVGTDGGNNQLQFDPFLIQLVRVVDSSNNEYCLEALSPTTPVDALMRRHLDKNGTPKSALGEMMNVLQTDYPSYVEVPREVEEKSYVWSEFARGDDRADEGGEINKFVGGKMFLVKFG